MTDENLRDQKASPRNLLIVAILVALAFSIGFLWQFLAAREARTELASVRTELTQEELGALLASAVIQVDNGGYENARQIMSEFFGGLRENLADASPAVRAEFEALLGRRDDVITALSRSDPAADRLLTRMYVRYQVATDGPGRGLPLPEPATGTDTAGTGLTMPPPGGAPATGDTGG